MKQLLAVFNGDNVNRYGFRFTVSTLVSSLEQSWKDGIPNFISHDYHRPISWSLGLCLHFEPGLTRIVGLMYVPETAEESSQISTNLRAYLAREIRKSCGNNGDALKGKLAEHLSGEDKIHFAGAVAVVDPGIAKRAFPELFAHQDKDGLIPLAELTKIAPGVFQRSGLLLFAHPFFRRSLSRLNTLNGPFLSAFQDLESKSDLTLRIALDEDMLGLPETYRETIELEYWWGPKFSEDLSQIPKGITRHEANEMQRHFHGLSRTEFWWHAQNDQSSLECEELRDIPSLGVSRAEYGCRYVHSMLIPGTSTPVHLDGAIRMYDEPAMLERLEMDIARAGHRSKYTKLWRIAGNIDIASWKELVAHYFRDNPLVGEYFGAEKVEMDAQPHELRQSDSDDERLGDYVKCPMEKNKGIRISISYREPIGVGSTPRAVHVLDSISRGEVTERFIESETTEIIKQIRSRGGDIHVPDGTSLFVFEDGVYNFPLILHAGAEARVLAEQTQQCIRTLCEVWARSSLGRLVSYSVGIQFEDRDVIFSFAGHAADLLSWFDSPQSRLPSDVQSMAHWCEEAADYLSSRYPPAHDTPALDHILKSSGILQFPRCFLSPEDYDLEVNRDTGGLIVKMQSAASTVLPIELMKSNKLGVTICFRLVGSKCSRCGSQYRECLCCKTTESDVTQIIDDLNFIGAFWSDRPIPPHHMEVHVLNGSS